MSTKTFAPRPRDIERRWYVVDADGAVLGRLASEVAKILRGKHKPIYAPHADTGDHVIVINAAGVRLTGAKAASKIYYRHSGYPGGIRALGYERLLSERPTLAVEKAIKGMLPKTRLGRQMLTKLAVYAGPDHPHQAQKPEPLELGEVPRWDGLPAPKPLPSSRLAEKIAAEPAKKAATKPAGKPAARRGRSTTSSTTTRQTAKRGAGKAAAPTRRSRAAKSETKES